MLADLLAQDGVVEDVVLDGRFGFMAFHGGSLERGTDEIAAAAASSSGSSLYCVRQPSDFRWHIPSTAFRPEDSAGLARFLAHVDVVVTVHGYGRDGFWRRLLLGGRNRVLATHVGDHLRTALDHYEVVDDLDAIPGALRGVHPQNPVNRPSGGGTQLELPPRIRGQGPYWSDHPDRPVPHTTALIAALAEAAAAWSDR